MSYTLETYAPVPPQTFTKTFHFPSTRPSASDIVIFHEQVRDGILYLLPQKQGSTNPVVYVPRLPVAVFTKLEILHEKWSFEAEFIVLVPEMVEFFSSSESEAIPVSVEYDQDRVILALV